MYKVETHNNSKEYFKSINIEKNSLYITSTTSLSNMIKEVSDVSLKDSWKILDIENFINSIYKNWVYILNQIKLKSLVREILLELKSNCNNNLLLNELIYIEENIEIFISDIKVLAQTNIRKLNYNKPSINKKAVQLIYNKLVSSEIYEEISKEILNPLIIKNSFKNIQGFNGEDITKVYFYNMNNLDLNRWLTIEMLKQSGLEVVFRIPYFHGLNVINKSWNMVYGDKNIFDWQSTNNNEQNIRVNSKFINYLEGIDKRVDNDEQIITKTYREISDLKGIVKNDKVITFYKDSLALGSNRRVDTNNDILEEIEHCFETSIGKFLMNLYKCKVEGKNVYLEFNTYRELITSGWIEYKDCNGIRLREYLMDNDVYFERIKTIDDIIERINNIKNMEEVNYIFEEQVKLRVKKDGQKKFLSNPFRAFAYNNLEKYNITANYMIQLTSKLKNFIIREIGKDNSLISIPEHFKELKILFTNTYIKKSYNTGSKVEKDTIKRIMGVLNSSNKFPKKMHKDDIIDLFRILLKFKNKESLKEEPDYSLDQLEGFMYRDKLSYKNGKKIIYISDLSYKAYEKYIDSKYIKGKILKDDDYEDIFDSSLAGKHREIVVRGWKLRNQSINSTEAYMKFIFGNLFINFQGIKELSWISELRKDDSKSIIFKQIESIYENNEYSYQGLELDDMVLEENIRLNKAPIYDKNELKKDYRKYSEVSYRDLDFCIQKFLYSSVLNQYPMYYSDFHHKLVFTGIVSMLKNSMNNSYFNIERFIFPLFSQWPYVVKQNILTCEYGRKDIRNYKYFDGINYPKNIDAIYLLKSKYVIGERWKIKNRYNKGNFKAEEYYSNFINEYLNEDSGNIGEHCIMCPYIYLCRKGKFAIDDR